MMMSCDRSQQGLSEQGQGLYVKDKDREKNFMFIVNGSLRTRTRTINTAEVYKKTCLKTKL